MTNGLAYSDAIRRIGVLHKPGNTKQDNQPYPTDIAPSMATYEENRQKSAKAIVAYNAWGNAQDMAKGQTSRSRRSTVTLALELLSPTGVVTRRRVDNRQPCGGERLLFLFPLDANSSCGETPVSL